MLGGVGITDESVEDPGEYKSLVGEVSQKGTIAKMYAASLGPRFMNNFDLLCSLSEVATAKPRGNPSTKSRIIFDGKKVREFLLDAERWMECKLWAEVYSWGMWLSNEE